MIKTKRWYIREDTPFVEVRKTNEKGQILSIKNLFESTTDIEISEAEYNRLVTQKMQEIQNKRDKSESNVLQNRQYKKAIAQSALAKLKALGLTADEAALIVFGGVVNNPDQSQRANNSTRKE